MSLIDWAVGQEPPLIDDETYEWEGDLCHAINEGDWEAAEQLIENRPDTDYAELFVSRLRGENDDWWDGLVTKHAMGSHDQLSHGNRYGQLFSRLSAPDGGFTIQPATGNEPTSGYSVAISTKDERVFEPGVITENNLKTYVQARLSRFRSDPDLHFGAWHDPESGKVYLDTVKVVSTPDAAMALARQHGQLAYFDFQSGQSVRVEKAKEQMCCKDGMTAEEHRHESPDGRCCTDDPPSDY